MNKKALIGIIVAVVAIIAIVWIVLAVNSGNNQNGTNGGGSPGGTLNQSSEITDTSVEGDRIEGSSLIVTNLVKSTSRSAKVTVVNAGDTLQNHMVKATFYDANGNEIEDGSFSAAAMEPGETKEVTMLVGEGWEDYASVKYETNNPTSEQ